MVEDNEDGSLPRMIVAKQFAPGTAEAEPLSPVRLLIRPRTRQESGVNSSAGTPRGARGQWGASLYKMHVAWANR